MKDFANLDINQTVKCVQACLLCVRATVGIVWNRQVGYTSPTPTPPSVPTDTPAPTLSTHRRAHQHGAPCCCRAVHGQSAVKPITRTIPGSLEARNRRIQQPVVLGPARAHRLRMSAQYLASPLSGPNDKERTTMHLPRMEGHPTWLPLLKGPSLPGPECGHSMLLEALRFRELRGNYWPSYNETLSDL